MRYLLLEVSEGGHESALDSGQPGFLFKVGPISEEEAGLNPGRIAQIRQFLLSVEGLNAKLGFGFHPATKLLRVIITSAEGFVQDAIPLQEISMAVKRDFPKMELYYRGLDLPMS